MYPIDRFEWSSESQVRSYLKCVLNHTQGISPTVLPLIGDYTKKPGYSGLPPAPDNKDSAIVGIRALCSCVIADIGDANRADENLFEMVESIDDSWTKDLKEILEHDLMQKGITNPQISVFPLPCQLYEVPKTGHRIHRDFKIDLMIEAAKSKLLKISEHGVPLQPVIYISDIVEDGIVTEIKLRGYAGDNRKDAFFQYDHIVAHQWEKPGDVLALINDIVGQLGAIPIYLQNGDSEN